MIKRLLPLLVCVFFSQNLFSQKSTLLKDINPGAASSMVNGEIVYCSFNESLIFSAFNASYGYEPWIYKNNEVTLLKDINPGANGSNSDYFFVLNDKVIFSAKTNETGFELWTTDGTTEGTQMLGDFNLGTKDGVFAGGGSSKDRFLVFNNKLYFTGIENQQFTLWATDGTKAGTAKVKNMTSTHYFPQDLTVFKNELYFSTSFNGVFKISKNTEEVVKVMDIDVPYSLLATNELLFAISGTEISVTSGTLASSKLVAKINSPSVNWNGNRMVELNKKVYFPNYTPEFGAELWETDGTTAGTKLVKDVWVGKEGYAPQNYTVFQNKLFYKGQQEGTGIELFQSDGTPAGTRMVLDITGNFISSFSLPSTLISDDKRLYFNAAKYFYSNLYISDGTAGGTRKVKVTKDLSADDEPLNFFLFKNKLVVFANSEEFGFEPYIINFDDLSNDPDGDGYFGEEDCDETNPNVNRGASEKTYNGLDDDCDPTTLDDDLDQDGYKKAVDCNDFDPDVNPGKVEIPYNGLDDDCNPATLDDDLDGDGFRASEDCNDTDKNINPRAKEIPNNEIDEDCDGIKQQIALGTSEEPQTLFKIYPNPSSGVMDLENVNTKSLIIHDVNGNTISFKAENQKLKLLNVSSGVYFIQGKTNNEQKDFTLKLVIVGK